MPGRVLVVDDLEPNVKLLEAKLENEYYDVFSAYNGKEALEKIDEVHPDIVLLDVMMPEMDGYEVCRRLRQNPATALTPVVMVTALSEIEDRIKGLEAGANDFLTKPIDDIHLMARVKSLVRFKWVLDELQIRDKTGDDLGLADESLEELYKNYPANVAILDDDIAHLKILKDALSVDQHTISEIDPSDYEKPFEEQDIDLAIINTDLDEIDGLRIAMHLRSQDKTRKMPIIILVEEEQKKKLIHGLEVGVDDYIITPIDRNELIARIRTQLQGKRYQERLRNSYKETFSAAVVDKLTGLYNRNYLDSHMQNLVDSCVKEGRPFSVIALDIDHFKEVNDRPGWGHAIGDEVLMEVGNRIKAGVRSTDLATRPGGEEFTIVLPKTDSGTAQLVAERIRQNMENKPIEISAEPYEAVCTISGGVATLIADESDAESLLKRADKALYEAKKTGRNKVVVYEEATPPKPDISDDIIS